MFTHSERVHDWGDRFIRKKSLDFDLINHEFSFFNDDSPSQKDILCQDVDKARFSTHLNNLKKVFLTDNKSSRILPIYSNKHFENLMPKRTKHWAVKPRKKPCITSPESVLDLPSIYLDLETNVLDWGASDYIAAGVSRYIHLWHATTHRRERLQRADRSTSATITSIKWHPNGNVLAYAVWNGELQMVDIIKQKLVASAKNDCHEDCFISAMDFHPLHYSLAVGCSKGQITKYSADLSRKMYSQMHNKATIMVTFSCDGTYLASSGYDKQIFVSRSNQLIFTIKFSSFCRGLAWHPWRSSHLVCGNTAGEMFLYNVAANKTIASYCPNIQEANAILCLSFSKITGELVSSHRINTEVNCTQLNVLESFDNVVDKISGDLGSIFYIKWNPDGTKLATAGSNEVVHIWNFLPPSKKGQQNEYRATENKRKIKSAKGTGFVLQSTNILGTLIR